MTDNILRSAEFIMRQIKPGSDAWALAQNWLKDYAAPQAPAVLASAPSTEGAGQVVAGAAPTPRWQPSMKHLDNDGLRDTAPDATDTPGIHSPFNACMFREGCRKAAAEIARLREDAERLDDEGAATTPETDEEFALEGHTERDGPIEYKYVLANFARKLERERNAARAAMQHEREGYECAIAYGYAADAQRDRAEKADAALADLKIKMAGNSRDYEVLLAELGAEIARLREDAERYHFLRRDFNVSSPNIDGNHAWAYRRNFSLKGPTLGAAIDTARKETK